MDRLVKILIFALAVAAATVWVANFAAVGIKVFQHTNATVQSSN